MNRIPNTLGVVSRADELLIIEDENSARRAVFHALENDVPLTILGGASNVVLLERVGGQVLLCRSRGIEVLERNASVIRVRVAAGEIWHSLVLWCLEQGIPGLENLALIPGSVGAAPIQNIGAYGVEVCEFVEAVEGVNLNDGELLELSAAECGFAYRDSVFKRDATVLVTALRLRFDPSRTPVTGYGDLAERVSEPTTGAIARAVIAIRQSKLPDPEAVGNVGSFFKNPVVGDDQLETLRGRIPDLVFYPQADEHKLAAAQLIDQAGWRGVSRYGVKTWERQPLVLVNDGATQGAQFLKFASELQQDIRRQFSVALEMEPVVIGEEWPLS